MAMRQARRFEHGERLLDCHLGWWDQWSAGGKERDQWSKGPPPWLGQHKDTQSSSRESSKTHTSEEPGDADDQSVEVLEYPELGMEAVWKIRVENFPAFIVVDDKGNDFFDQVGTGTPISLR